MEQVLTPTKAAIVGKVVVAEVDVMPPGQVVLAVKVDVALAEVAEVLRVPTLQQVAAVMVAMAMQSFWSGDDEQICYR